jgi:hypothetical protein
MGTDFTTPVFAWTMIESSLAVVGANLPLLRPLLHQKTYTSSYVWSLLRSLRTRHSENSSEERVGSESGGSFKNGIQFTNKEKSSQGYILKTDTPRLEQGKPCGECIYVHRKYEVA